MLQSLRMALHVEILVRVDTGQFFFPDNSEKNYLMDLK